MVFLTPASPEVGAWEHVSWFFTCQGLRVVSRTFWMLWCVDLDSPIFPQGLLIFLKQVISLLDLNPGDLICWWFMKCQFNPWAQVETAFHFPSDAGVRSRWTRSVQPQCYECLALLLFCSFIYTFSLILWFQGLFQWMRKLGDFLQVLSDRKSVV